MSEHVKNSKHSAVLIGELGHKKSLYEVLGLPNGASVEDVERAHKALLRDIHSRKEFSNTEEAALQLKLIQMAYETLTIEHSRILYNKRIGLQYTDTAEEAKLSALLDSIPETDKQNTLREVALREKFFRKLALISILAGMSIVAMLFSVEFAGYLFSKGIN